MAYNKKSHLIEALDPYVILSQEVAKKDIGAGNHPFAAGSGSNPNRGLGSLWNHQGALQGDRGGGPGPRAPLRMGDPAHWLAHSDRMPMILDVE